MTNETKFCSNCGEKIDVKTEICPKCGVRAMASTTIIKNPGIAAILSFFTVVQVKYIMVRSSKELYC